jgi:hypothetical protein
MRKKSKSPEVSWHIYRIRRSPAELIGYVTAKDQDSAVDKYVAERKLTDPLEQKRLHAMRS